jgi:hypothetical protein
MKNSFLFLTALLALSACSTRKIVDTSSWTRQPVERAVDFRAGTSVNEVIQIMGKPIAHDFGVKGAAMQWCHTGESADRFVVGFFYNEKLVGMRSYTGGGYGDCATQYKNIEWRPSDTVIEYRFR